MSRFLDLANAITMLGLVLALACALLAIEGRPALGVIALVLAGLCDLFDGLVARRTRRSPETSAFGARLDSLVDVCAFGFAPAILLHSLGLTRPHELVLLALFVSAAVWRVAYFDSVGLTVDGRGGRYYVGLPTTYVALVLPIAFLAGFAGLLRPAATAAALILPLAMVSPLPIRKPAGLAYAGLSLLALAMVAIYALASPI